MAMQLKHLFFKLSKFAIPIVWFGAQKLEAPNMISPNGPLLILQWLNAILDALTPPTLAYSEVNSHNYHFENYILNFHIFSFLDIHLMVKISDSFFSFKNYVHYYYFQYKLWLLMR